MPTNRNLFKDTYLNINMYIHVDKEKCLFDYYNTRCNNI